MQIFLFLGQENYFFSGIYGTLRKIPDNIRDGLNLEGLEKELTETLGSSTVKIQE